MENPFRDDGWKLRENPFLRCDISVPPKSALLRFFWKAPGRRILFLWIPFFVTALAIGRNGVQEEMKNGIPTIGWFKRNPPHHNIFDEF